MPPPLRHFLPVLFVDSWKSAQEGAYNSSLRCRLKQLLFFFFAMGRCAMLSKNLLKVSDCAFRPLRPSVILSILQTRVPSLPASATFIR